MYIQAYILIFLLLSSIILLFLLYKLIWYAVKLAALKSTLKYFNKGKSKITFLRFPLSPRSKKGETNFVIQTSTDTFNVSVLSFFSANSRWNIEKTKTGYYAESRYKDKLFYKTEKNSGTEPEFAREYRRETRIQRAKLHLSPKNNSMGKNILLIYPRPKLITYTDLKINYIKAGDRIENYEIMFADELVALLEEAESDNA